MVASIVKKDKNGYIFSYQSQGYIDCNHYTLKKANQLVHPHMDITYSMINDTHLKSTEYYELDIMNEKHIVYIHYMKTPKGFSYKKAKEIYKNEIISYIDNQMKQLEFDTKMIGIQYFNQGYSIMDVSIGFEKDDNEDVLSMTECIEFSFSNENWEIINILDNYINVHGYFQAFHKLMISIEDELIEKYKIEVILDEIID